MYKSQGATGMMGRINKQRQARGGNSGFQRAALRRNIISQTTGSAERMSRQIEGSSIPASNPLPPKIPPGNKNAAASKPKYLAGMQKQQDAARSGTQINSRYLVGGGHGKGGKKQQGIGNLSKEEKLGQQPQAAPIGQLFQFDPANMTKTDIVNIAENADNLIKIISNIKHQVAINNDEAPAEEDEPVSDMEYEEEDEGVDDPAQEASVPRKKTGGQQLNEDLQFYDSRGMHSSTSERKGRRFTQQIEIG